MNTTDNDPVARLRHLEGLLERTVALSGAGTDGLEIWQKRLAGIIAAAEDGGSEPLRIAIAGTVKSGKTTLANALIGADLLKRGAGIITSIVTRVRRGDALRAHILLKGWPEVNREATDAALFLGFESAEGGVELRDDATRAALAAHLSELGGDALDSDGGVDKHAALLGAFLEGYERISALLSDEIHEISFDADRFAEHRDFAGSDALAAFVDDLTLEIPGFPFSREIELADCQGYDSPNPRHREKVQEYLLGCHQVIYVVSSRVGLREADIKLFGDLSRMGLIEATHVVLNADLTEHDDLHELTEMERRVSTELRPFGAGIKVQTFSALWALLDILRTAGHQPSRRDALLMELWNDAGPAMPEAFKRFSGALGETLVNKRAESIAKLSRDTYAHARSALKTYLETVCVIAQTQSDEFEEVAGRLVEAEQLIERSLEGFRASIEGRTAEIRARAFNRSNEVFHPSSGSLTAELVAHIGTLTPTIDHLDRVQGRELVRQLSHIQQQMREMMHAYKVGAINAKAVEHIRSIWGEARDGLGEAAHDAAEMVIETAEGYRALALELEMPVEVLVLPELEPDIGKRTVPLFSAVTNPSAGHTAERVLGFARQWSVNVATGLASRLFGRKDKAGLMQSLLADGVEAAREMLVDESRSCLLNYNEQVKYQVVGKNLDDLAREWLAAYGETVSALVVDISSLRGQVDESKESNAELVPQLEKLLQELADS